MISESRIARVARDTDTPVHRARPQTIRVHGESLLDEFGYMRDAENPLTRRSLDSERQYFEHCMSGISDLRRTLYLELKSRIREEDVSVPETMDGYVYYTRTEAGRAYPIHCRAPGAGGGEQVYLDENYLAEGCDYCEVSVLAILPEKDVYAFTVDRAGDERYDLVTGSFSRRAHTLCVECVGDSVAWSLDGAHLFYTGLDPNARPDSVWMYDMKGGSHRCIYREPDPAFHVSVWGSRNRHWIFIDTSGNSTSETLILSASMIYARPQTVLPRRQDVEYSVEHHEDRLLVLINDESENFRLLEYPIPPSGETEPRELLPAREDTVLEFVDAYRHHLVVGERTLGVERTWIWDLKCNTRHYLDTADELGNLDVEDLHDYNANYVRFEYSTPVHAHRIQDYDVASGTITKRKELIPPGYDESSYQSERRRVPGVEVPLTLIYRKDQTEIYSGKDSAPVLMLGYGAYEETLDTEFDSDMISLLDRGVVIALAHVRGGGELGPAWHDAGRLEQKDNSFRDFIACANYLVRTGITKAGRIAAWGSSAGGLLVAVAVQRRPELFASAVLEVPFVDVLCTLMDPDLPLSEYDYDEFGDPAEEEEYRWIRAYSPYENVAAQAYPPMLVTTAMNDQRVGFWEGLKWVARLRARKTDHRPLLLKVDDAGHLGESSRYGALRETSDLYAFLLDIWGLGTSARSDSSQ